jgi:hypothetical protein
MQVNPEVKKMSGCVLARYVKIIPSFTPGTVLEFSKILVRNVTRTNAGTRPNIYVSRNAVTARYNMSYELEEVAMSQPDSQAYLRFLTDERGGTTPSEYPNIFRAASNNPLTFFLLDLNPPSGVTHACSPTTIGRNFDIYDIQFVGTKDRTFGGIKGITIELYADRPQEPVAYRAFDGTSYDPVFRYILPKDDPNPPPILVAPPAKCTFTTTLEGIQVLKKPTFLRTATPPLSEPDTSGGVFGFSSVVNAIGSAWNSLLPIDPTGLATDVTNSTKKSNEVVHTMLETLSKSTSLLDTGKGCKDPEVLKRITMLYNIQRAPRDTQAFNVEKQTMTRILKSGQSTPNTCDVLFENLTELYDDYTVDITAASDKEKKIKAARFSFTPVDTALVPDPKSIVYDISSNALGLIAESAALTPVYSGPYSSLDCRNPGLVAAMKAAIFRGPVTNTERKVKVETQFKRILQSFQTTPLTCEYRLQKLERYTSLATNLSYVSNPITTFAKALFSVAPDGYTAVFSSAKEYDPNNVTFSPDNTISYLNKVPTSLPSIFYYDTSKGVTTSRIISSQQNM